MKVAVIGADGFVGRNLVSRAANNYKCFDNGFLHGRLGQKTMFVDISSDIGNLEIFFAENEGNFIVINLAAIHHIPYCNNHPSEANFVNVYGNMRLFELAAKYKCKNYIFASSGAVYQPRQHSHKEDDFRQSSDVYSATKILAEDYLFRASSAYDVPVISLRFFNIVGALDFTPHLVPDIVEQLLSNDGNDIQLGNLETVRDYISVADICMVMEHIIKFHHTSKGFSVLNVGTGVGHSGYEVLEALIKLTNSRKKYVKDVSRIRVSDRPMQVADISLLKSYIGHYAFEPLESSLSSYLNWRINI